jgi:hypothetical protein
MTTQPTNKQLNTLPQEDHHGKIILAQSGKLLIAHLTQLIKISIQLI